MLRSIVAVLIFALPVSAAEPDYVRMKKDYGERIAQLKADAIKNAKTPKEKAEAEKFDYEHGSSAPRITDMKPGDFSKLSEEVGGLPIFTVIQVQNPKAALMKWGGKVFWVELDTSALVDGEEVRVSEWVHILGKKEYQSAGGKKTVTHVRLVK